ncbi:S8/S53 family peptidase [Nonomuraea sp. NEAU-L178]|nr:S8/S53 family peptidase [Nonomuraea aurantiaca]MCA2222138.1 S8/S53 family peptidase [Nonomuraea aurantiaca]
MAPSTDVRVHNGFPYGGAVEEDRLGLLLLQTLDTHGWPDVLSLSAGTRTNDAQALLGLADFIDELAVHPETLLVAAAGNDGESVPFWPAAFAAEAVNATGDVIVSVGALREDGLGRACFSNHGDWVTVYAPGERLINAYTSGDYEHPFVPAHVRAAARRVSPHAPRTGWLKALARKVNRTAPGCKQRGLVISGLKLFARRGAEERTQRCPPLCSSTCRSRTWTGRRRSSASSASPSSGRPMTWRPW